MHLHRLDRGSLPKSHLDLHFCARPVREFICSNWRRPLLRRLRTAVAAIALVSLAACAGWPARDHTPDTGELLQNSLPVAAAAFAAGQLEVARRLYVSLADRFDDAPEPLLGLGHIAFRSGDFAEAEKHFLQAAERAADASAMQAQALLGAGRTALVQGRTGAALRHFRRAQAFAQDTPSAAWIANGLALIATIRAEYAAAESHYAYALRHSSGHPRIAANFVRMLVAAGRIDEAAGAYREHPPTYWAGDDGPALSRLVEEARRKLQRQALANAPAGARDAPPDTSGALSGIASAQSGRDTPPIAPSDSTPALTRPEHPDLGLSLRLLHPEVVLRLEDLSSTTSQPNADTLLSRETAPADPSRLILRLDGWTQSDSPALAADGPVPALAFDADSLESGAPVPAPGLSESGTNPARISPAPWAPSGPARPGPVSGSEEVVVSMLDSSSAPALALVVGQSRRLHLDHDASSVLVASPEIADVRLLAPDVLYVIGEGVGRTTVAVIDDEKRVAEWVVSVALDLEPVRAVLARGSGLDGIHVRRLTRGVTLTGEVASAEVADRALRLAAGTLPEGVTVENELRIAAPLQVNLEVQIAEVHRAVTEDLGVNWEAFRIRGNEGFGFRIGRKIGGFPDVLNNLVSEPPVPVGTVPPPTIVDGQISPSVYFGRRSANTRIAAMVDALATAGLANVLARPNLTAVSGESASFFSGGEFPLPTGFEDGVLVFEYKKYGVLLDFVPTVVDADRIVLTVRPEVSEPSRNQAVTIIQGVTVPVINVRRAETTVEVADGESIVIAGLFRNASNTVEAGLPGLKDVPLLGLLFGTTSIRSDELELIVIVTARLVQPNPAPDDPDATAATLRVDGYHY